MSRGQIGVQIFILMILSRAVSTRPFHSTRTSTQVQHDASQVELATVECLTLSTYGILSILRDRELLCSCAKPFFVALNSGIEVKFRRYHLMLRSVKGNT